MSTAKKKGSVEELLNDAHQVLPCVYYLRLLAKRHLLSDPQLLHRLSTEGKHPRGYQETTDSFLNRTVLSMGQTVTEPVILALYKSLLFPMEILEKKIEGTSHSYFIGSTSSKSEALFFLKNNYYSVLYPLSTPPNASHDQQPLLDSTKPSRSAKQTGSRPSSPLLRVLQTLFSPLIAIWNKLFR